MKKSRSRPGNQCKTDTLTSPALRSRTQSTCKTLSKVSQANAVMLENSYSTSCLWRLSRSDLIQPRRKARYLYMRAAATASQSQLLQRQWITALCDASWSPKCHYTSRGTNIYADTVLKGYRGSDLECTKEVPFNTFVVSTHFIPLMRRHWSSA